MTDVSFYQQIYPILTLMPIAASGFLALILTKGEICPGQRKRISENMISIWAVLALGLMMGVEAYASLYTLVFGGVAVLSGIALNLLQARLAGKRSVPGHWLKVPIFLALAAGLILLWQWQQPVLLLEALLLGAVFAHVILLRANYRLTAFNTILPAVGLVCAVLLMLSLGLIAYLSGDPAALVQVQSFVIYRALILLAALGIWGIPLFSQHKYSPNLVSVTTVLLLFSEVMNMGIIMTLTY